jgi:hypothetical protein
MNAVQLHLGLVHFPIVGAFFSLLIFVLAVTLRSDLLFRIGFGFTIFCAFAAAASYFTGGEAFEALKDQLDADIVERHALVARSAFLLYTLGGVGALAALLQELQEEPAAPALRWALLAVNLFVFGVLLWAAHLGGLIRHPEIAPPVESVATLFL